MKLTPLAACCALLCSTSAFAETVVATLVDQTRWDLAARTTQNLPTQSAWYANNVSSVPTLTNNGADLYGTGHRGTAPLWVTYFTTTSPYQLRVGDALRVRMTFNADGVVPENTSRALRVGLLNFANGVRRERDGWSSSAQGAGVTGYMLNQNFGTTFGIIDPVQIMERTDIANNSMVGTSGAYTSLSSGGGAVGDPAFTSFRDYLFEMEAWRAKTDKVYIKVTFTSLDPANPQVITHTAVDTSGATTAFDTFAIRSDVNTYLFLTIKDFKVDVVERGEEVLTPFQVWASENSLPAGQDGALGDPDRDGIPNLVEYALGMSPTNPSLELQGPVLGRSESGGVRYVTYTFNKVAAEVPVVAQVASGLAGPWNVAGTVSGVLVEESGPTVVVRVPESLDAGFIRLVVGTGT